MRDKRALASRLRHRVDLVRPTETSNGKGGYTRTAPVIAAAIAAEVISLTGSEAVKEKVLRGIRVYRVTVRWRGDLRQTDQLRLGPDFGCDLVNIRSAVDHTGKRCELVIHGDTETVAP